MFLDIIEIFASVQGETANTGLPTTFIRLARCNLRCSWCDTAYSFKRGAQLSVDSILHQVQEFGLSHICITGGEPLLQENVHPLMAKLCDLGYQLTIETGGSLDIDPIDPRVRVILDIKCPGSGMSEKNLWKNLFAIRPQDEVKFVIKNEEDYAFAKNICEKHALFKKTGVLFSPVHGVCESKELVQWMLKDKLPARLNLQIHKFIWDPATRGV